MRVQISRWGNSVAVRLPKKVAERYGFVAGREAELELDARGVHLAPALGPVPSWAEMIAEATARGGPGAAPDDEVDWGADVGAERIDDAPEARP